MKPTRARAILLFLLALILTAAGCASSSLRQDPALEDEVVQLRQRIVELQREARMNEVEITRLREQVAELEARNGGARPTPASTSSAHPSSALSRPSETRAPAQAPRSTVPARPSTSTPPAPVAAAPQPRERVAAAPAPTAPPVSTAAPSQRPAATAPAPARTAPAPRPENPDAPAPRQVIEEEDLDVPQTAPGRPTASTPPAPPAQTPPTQVPPAGSGDDEAELLSLSAQALYDRGYTLYHQGRFVDAETSFQRFLQTDPGNELADNAQYWIGECRYARSDTRGALAAFREVIEKHPKGNKVPDALLKAGQCLESMGDIEGARVTYREVIRRFPGSAAAGVAEERRAKLP